MSNPNPIAANVLGTLGAICWSVQLIPQIIINYRRHNAEGLQPTMMMLWAWAGVPLGVYNIVSSFNIALQIQPQILSGLSLATWIQCRYYEDKWPLRKSLAVVLPIALLMAGIEIGLVYALRLGEQRAIRWPTTIMALLAALLLALGVLRHYWDIYCHRTVRGISFLFVGIDALGDLTSILSLVFQVRLDVLGLVVYGVELALWTGIFACGAHYRLLPWLREKLQHEARSPQPGYALEQNAGAIASFESPSTANALYLQERNSSSSVFRTPDGELRARTAPYTSSPADR